MKITDEVYALEATKGSYSYIILGKNKILVDTGQVWQGRGILKELSNMNIDIRDIENIVLTHHDLDHVGNASMLQSLTKAKLWAAEEDIPYILGHKNRPGIKRVFSFICRPKKPKDIYAYCQDDSINGIEIIPTPGHTPGHVCVIYKDVLFVGDLVETTKGRLRKYPNMNWDEKLLRESIDNISKLKFKWICPAHGKPIERGEKWELL